MSAFTTVKLTRTKATQILMTEIALGFSDERLEKIMDEILEPRLYNTQIVPDDHEGHTDDDWI